MEPFDYLASLCKPCFHGRPTTGAEFLRPLYGATKVVRVVIRLIGWKWSFIEKHVGLV